MTLALHVVAVEIVDTEMRELLATVKTFDSHCAEIVLSEKTHTAESWSDLAAGISRAVGLLELEAA